MNKSHFAILRLFIKLYALALFVFFVFRLALFFVENKRLEQSVNLADIAQAFIMGLRFDIVITGYILILPFFVLSVYSHFSSISPSLKKIVFAYVFFFFSLAFLVCSADIPYFGQFFSRFSYAALEWFENPLFVFKMIVQEPSYWMYILLYIPLVCLFYVRLKKLIYTDELCKNNLSLYFSIPVYLLATGLIFLGIRGRTDEKSPIRVGTAFFSNNAFLNQLGLNPNFTLIRSYLDQQKSQLLTYMDNSIAINNMQNYLQIQPLSSQHPLHRDVLSSIDSIQKHNVVIVLMESMSAYYLKRNGNTENLVPFLDSIAEKSYFFENFYTAGIHTHNGIFSTLFSYPAIAKQHSMKESNVKRYNGIAATLKDKGYATIYFTTHDGQFDNAEGFLMNNQFETVISKKDYPVDKIKTTLGVPDDYLFEFSIPILTKIHADNQPFLSVFMTASNHGPYYIPEYYTPASNDIKKQIIEYSDWSLQRFLYLAKQQPWFENTIFVFLADHGVSSP